MSGHLPNTTAHESGLAGSSQRVRANRREVTLLNGDSIDGWEPGDALADEEEDDTTFVCTGPRDCWNECQKFLVEKDGSSTTCKCTASKILYICEVKHGPGEGSGGGGDNPDGDGCADGGDIPTDTLRYGPPACVVDVAIDCGAQPERGSTVECIARTSWDNTNASIQYTWTAGGNSKHGTRELSGSYWRGRAIDSKSIKVKVEVEHDDTLIFNRTSKMVRVHPRQEWRLDPGWPTEGSPKKNGRHWPVPGRTWGTCLGDIEEPDGYNPGTLEGSGPWEGDGYIARNPPEVRAVHLYWRPDIRLKNGHPDYAHAADSTCQNNGLPDFASMLDVNTACNTLSAFTTWHWQIRAHEWEHHNSLARCGAALFNSGALGEMESRVGTDANTVTMEVEELYEKQVHQKLLKARRSKQPNTISADSLWIPPWVHGGWSFDYASGKGHNDGTNGC